MTQQGTLGLDGQCTPELPLLPHLTPKQKGGRGLGHWREASEAERLSQRDVDSGPESGVVSVFPARPQQAQTSPCGLSMAWAGTGF